MKKIKILLIAMVLILIPIRILADASVSTTTMNLEVGETKNFTFSVTKVGGKFTIVSNDTSKATVTSPLLEDNGNVDDGLVASISGGVRLWMESVSSTPDTKTLTVRGIAPGSTKIVITAVDAADYVNDDNDFVYTKEINVTVTPKTYKVTYGLNGGDAWTSTTCPSSKFTLSSSTCSKTVTSGSTYGDLPTPTRNGYTFNGWNTSSGGSGTTVTSSTTVTATSNHTIYAMWTKNSEDPVSTYKVTFGLNGGDAWTSTTCPSGKFTLSSSTCSKTVTVGSAFGDLPAPTREGYIFESWNTKADGTGTTVTSSSVVNATANYTIYAMWVKDTTGVDDPGEPGVTYTLTYDSNGGSTCSSKVANENEAWGTLCVPSYEGYTFRGWFTSKTNGTEVKSSTKAVGDITVYARWTENSTGTNANTGIFTPIAAIVILLVASVIAFITIKRKSDMQF